MVPKWGKNGHFCYGKVYEGYYAKEKVPISIENSVSHQR